MPIFNDSTLFIHIPRTGGSIMEKMLGKNNKITLYGPDKQRFSRQHYTLNKIINTYKGADKLFTFTFVRNPFDRILSSYLNWSIQNSKNFDTFIDMVKHIVENRLYEKIPYINTNDTSHYIPQVEMIGNHKLDFIGKFENYEEDKQILFSKIPLNVIDDQPIKKRKINYRDYYSNRNRQIIEDIYKKDLERFKYEF